MLITLTTEYQDINSHTLKRISILVFMCTSLESSDSRLFGHKWSNKIKCHFISVILMQIALTLTILLECRQHHTFVKVICIGPFAPKSHYCQKSLPFLGLSEATDSSTAARLCLYIALSYQTRNIQLWDYQNLSGHEVESGQD